MRLTTLITEITAALDGAAAIAMDEGYELSSTVSLPVRIRYRHGAVLEASIERPERQGSAPRNPARLVLTMRSADGRAAQ